LYERALCLVFPSTTEGFGIPPLEATALGCPVISSNAASLKEVGGDAVIYVGPDDGDRWREAIIALSLCKRRSLRFNVRKGETASIAVLLEA
jgi:glycosyltransferase involved in cell wall biosynthesis